MILFVLLLLSSAFLFLAPAMAYLFRLLYEWKEKDI